MSNLENGLGEISYNNRKLLVPQLMINILSNRLGKQAVKKLDYLDDIESYIETKLGEGKTKEDILKVFQRLFKNYAVPGIVNKDGELSKVPTLDGKASLFLLRRFGFKTNDVFLLGKPYSGYRKNNYVNIGNDIDGFIISNFNNKGLRSFFYDATISINDKEISNVYIVYKILERLGAIPESELKTIKKFASFIHFLYKGKIDFLRGEGKEFYENSYKTLYGIAQFLPIDFVYDYISRGNTGFEILEDNFLNTTVINKRKGPTVLKYFSDLKRSQIIQGLESMEYTQEMKYHNQNLSFILDLEANLPNGIELISALGKGLIKVNKNGTIMILNPKGFPKKMSFLGAGKTDKLVFLNRKDDDYYEKIEKLLGLLTNKFAKYNLLRKIGYKGDLYEKLNLPESEFEKEYKKRKVKITKNKMRRRKNKNKIYEKQNFLLEDLRVGQKIYGKIAGINGKNRVFVDIGLKTPGCEVYVTPTRLKGKEYYMKKIWKNKLTKTPDDREDILLYFKIIDIEIEGTSTPKIRLVQI